MDAHYDARTWEKKMQEFWEQEGIYRFNPNSDKPIYSIDTPPPTVSGNLHIGHLFSYTQAEIMARYKRMQGYEVFYPFGFDDNGLPTERLVERELGVQAKDMPRDAFRNQCIAVAERYENEFQELWKSLGFSVDWSLCYETIGPLARKISQRCFLELVEKGKAYQKESPVLWCPHCQTSIAQAELGTKETETVFYTLRFAGEEGDIPVATTRPELLFGCGCLLVHPDDPRYQSQIGRQAWVPLYNRAIPVYADEGVSMETGSGAVMCATFGDRTDVDWFARYDLPYRRTIMPDGRLDPEIPYIGNMPIRKARAKVVNLLEEQGVLLASAPQRHMVAIHERCGKETEILLSKQWYIDILTQKQHFLEAADRIQWHPAHMKERYRSWVENLKWDWCISRQRYFGVPFPIWYCSKCGRPIFADPSQLPVDPTCDAPLHGCACGGVTYIPETSVLDTWATSSISGLINSHYQEPEYRGRQLLPMGMRAQAHEIIRTWAFYSIVRSLYHTGDIPWRDIMVSGFVLAKKGEKFSKSKQNATTSPSTLIQQHSADALRYWSAASKLGTDTFFAQEDLAGAKRFLTKLWNAARFVLERLEGYEPAEEQPPLMPIDGWILAKLASTAEQAKKELEDYEIGAARQILDGFFWNDFCGDYLELVKERIYQPEQYGEKASGSGQYALYHSFLGIIKLYAIYVPHITEYLYQHYYRKREGYFSLHQHCWNFTRQQNSELLEFGTQLQDCIRDIRKYKSVRGLALKSELDSWELHFDERIARYFRISEQDVKACCHIRHLLYR